MTQSDQDLQARIDSLIQECINDTDKDDLAFLYKYNSSVTKIISPDKLIEIIRELVKSSKLIFPFSKYSLHTFSSNRMTLDITIPIEKIKNLRPDLYEEYLGISNFQEEITFLVKVIYEEITSKITTYLQEIIVPQGKDLDISEKNMILLITSSTGITVNEKSDKESRRINIEFTF